MDIFTQIVYVIGKIKPEGVHIVGTGFLISPDGKIATTKHNIGTEDKDLVIVIPHIKEINAYQDTTDRSVNFSKINVLEIDPLRDIAILQSNSKYEGRLPPIGSLDEINVSDTLDIFGFPHSTDGRKVLTFQRTSLGAKILLESEGQKSKCGVLNIQSRPGQSGSLIFSSKIGKIVGMLIGTYSPSMGGVSIMGINPQELNQTTHFISAEYLNEML